MNFYECRSRQSREDVEAPYAKRAAEIFAQRVYENWGQFDEVEVHVRNKDWGDVTEWTVTVDRSPMFHAGLKP